MAFKVLRGTNAQRLGITPAEGELVFVTNYTATSVRPLWIGDGSTVGGVPVDAPASLTFTGVASDIISDVTNTRDIGSSAIKWAEGHFTNIYGDLTGNVTGNVTGDTAGVHTGAVTGAVTGNVTGNLTGNVTGNVTGDVVGNIAGSVLAADATVLLNDATKEATLTAIFSTGDAVLQTSTDSISDPVVIGSPTDPKGLYIYARNDGTGGAEATLTISGVSQVTTASRMVFETVGSAGTLDSPSSVLAGDATGAIEFRGLYSDGLGPYYPTTGIIASEVVSLGATDLEGVVGVLVPDALGVFERFNMASNGTFNSKTAIFGVSGDIVTAGFSNAPAGVALDVRGITKLEIRTSPPASPVNGMITIQDGATWDPAGTGVQAVVAYINGGWVKLN
jgi:hypothetical protein